ncbi:hypothetical protein EJ08DRAFT_667129 [Tothia fuscella]|uniref:Uncharacterized protein n=1 Tax=Tothia fuscella TaxID=1048955 RepID=A0A9P4U5H4_9PEZI|nr:hypothetical protein EJ08DRAFT_667129 [Tothia fuscella]
MPASLAAHKISPADFETTLSRYTDIVPSNLAHLETYRLETLPSDLKDRQADNDDSACWLEKVELQQLVDWKLHHGTYRPSLAKLVASNSGGDVKSITEAALSGFTSGGRQQDSSKRLNDALKTLTKLKGIGPATASLILSSFDPENIPFFSDELFRWLHWDGKNNEGKTDGIKQVGKGWSRQIGYTAKEYAALCNGVDAVRERLRKEGKEVSAIELEKVVYVLGKEGVDVDEDGDDEGVSSPKTLNKEVSPPDAPHPKRASKAQDISTSGKRQKKESQTLEDANMTKSSPSKNSATRRSTRLQK